MTRKDYTLLAASILEARRQAPESLCDEEFNRTVVGAIRLVAERQADALAADNPRFDRARFLEAALGCDPDRFKYPALGA